MSTKLKISASALSLVVFGVLAPSSASAADVIPEGCGLAVKAQVGYLFGNNEAPIGDESRDADWTAWFGEAGGLVNCGSFNVQADFAHYDHETTIDLDEKDLDIGAGAGHIGGALFWRDASVGSIALMGSLVDQEVLFKDIDLGRIGLGGEYFVNDQFTIGASGHYFASMDDYVPFGDYSGFELVGTAKFYATPDFSFGIEGAYLNSQFSGSGGSADFDGFAITGEAEYLFMDEGLSGFVGARYAQRTFEDDFDMTDWQVYAGLTFQLGGNASSLVERDRSGPINNTSTHLEKLPNFFSALTALGGT